MFTGIIKDIGTLRRVEDNGTGRRIMIGTNLDLSKKNIGDSISCSGCCLTVVEKGSDWFSADVSGETLSKTTIGCWKEGDGVNLEGAMQMGDEFGGHFVSGHVDGLAVLEEIALDGDSHRMRFRVPDALESLIASKGCVAVDGISLTVNEVRGPVFGVNIIPHTFENTTLGGKKVGDTFNLEVDLIARYIKRIMDNAA